MKRIFVLTITLSCLVACLSPNIENVLNDVESYIAERPDSALTVLDGIDREALKTNRLRAHHALLHAMALDKNYVDVSDDSLALTALKYYERHGNKKYKARALYYLGLSYYYSQEYDKAILEFTKAEGVAQKYDSLYWGMTKIAQADTYSMTYNNIEELKCVRKATEINRDLKHNYYIQTSNFRLASILYDMKELEVADSITSVLISSPDTYPNVLQRAYITYAYAQATLHNNYVKASELYLNICNEYGTDIMSIKDYWALAYSLNKLGRKEESESLIEQLRTIDDGITADYWQYVISKEYLDYKSALNYLEKTSIKNEVEVKNALMQELSIKQRDYFEAKSELSIYKMRNRTLIMTSTVLILIMISGYILILFRKQKRKQEEERESYMGYIEEITRQLNEAKNYNDTSLKRKYINLYKSKFEVLRTLCDQYLMAEDRVDAKNIMYKKVISLVDELRTDNENKIKFEAMLDNDLDGIMTNIRNELPRLKEIDYTIFSYWIIGFDATTISRLLNTSLNIVYIRKTRLKQHILEKSTEHMNQFLEMIS